MKQRTLVPRGVVRYFRDNHRDYLWKWSASCMTVRDTYEGNLEWRDSIRVPHAVYESKFREITPVQAKRSFPNCFIDPAAKPQKVNVPKIGKVAKVPKNFLVPVKPVPLPLKKVKKKA